MGGSTGKTSSKSERKQFLIKLQVVQCDWRVIQLTTVVLQGKLCKLDRQLEINENEPSQHPTHNEAARPCGTNCAMYLVYDEWTTS